jgi:hypothetical protein
MSRLTSNAAEIELANSDTQLLFTDLTDGTVEVYLEHEEDHWTKDVAFGNFTPEEMTGLADLLYLRYSRNVPLGNSMVKYDA